jgi:SagB-type dehydrogenase family enzyme
MTAKISFCLTLVGLFALTASMIGCAQIAGPSAAPSGPGITTALPPPSLDGEASLEETLSRRRSVREFSNRPLTTAELGQLLWAAQGRTNERGFRTAPSAGALYPLEIYVATAEGVFHYDPQHHRLLVSSLDDARPRIYDAALKQEPLRQAPALFIVTALYERTAQKYGAERSPRYVHLEAGHAAQNLLLQAVALDLGAVPIGAFYDQQILQVLGLSADYTPLYLIPVGHPAGPGP